MSRRPPRPTRTAPLFPSTTLFRSAFDPLPDQRGVDLRIRHAAVLDWPMRVRGDVGIARRERLGLLYRRRAHRRYLANMRCRPASGVSVREQERAASCAASYAGRVTSETSNKSAAVRSEEHTAE